MLKSFDVSNFRCFQSVNLRDLKRVNIVTGASASGKSALLESIFFAARGTAEGVLWLNQLRGLPIPVNPLNPTLPLIVSPVISPQFFRPLWEHWFYGSSENASPSRAKKISFCFSDTDQKNYTLDVSFLGEEPIASPQVSAGSFPQSAVIPVIFERTINGKATKVQINIGPHGQIISQPPVGDLGPSVFIFSSVLNYAESDNVTWFSQLREKGQADSITNLIKDTFPFITGLEVLAPSGITGIYANLKSGGLRRLQLVSSGIHKILTILLACAFTENGIVLVDEIENGLFYENYELIWSTLYEFTEKSRAQLFVTSHSAECLRKLAPVINGKINDFSLLRAERQNGQCVVRHISGAAMKAALDRGGEPRGATVAPDNDKA
jgi:hypothetical protein